MARAYFPAKILAAVGSLVALVAFFGWLLTPDVIHEDPVFDSERIAEAEALRDVRVDNGNPVTVSHFAENYNALSGAPLRDPAYSWTASAFLIMQGVMPDHANPSNMTGGDA